MNDSKTLSGDPQGCQRPIFEIADYGIVSDLFQVAPAIVELLKRVR